MKHLQLFGLVGLEITCPSPNLRIQILKEPASFRQQFNRAQVRNCITEWVTSTLLSQRSSLIFTLSIFFGVFSLRSQTVDENMWVPNGAVHAICRSANTIYVGGDFSFIGPSTGGGAAIDASTGQPNLKLPRANGNVLAVCPDGSGGWYIGGNFTRVGGIVRSHLARIRANGLLDESWNPNADRVVNAIVISDSTVFVGGEFRNVGGQRRNRIAALDMSSGLASNWDPDANSTVLDLAVSNSAVYVCGYFTHIGGVTRSYVAAIDRFADTAMTWNPDADQPVSKLELSDSAIYVCGGFSRIGGKPRNYIAALDMGSSSATSWNPSPDAGVDDLVLSGPTIYVGGNFTNIGGWPRNRLAALDTVTGAATSWNPDAENVVAAIAQWGSSVLVGGRFTIIGGQERRHLAAIDMATGQVATWNPGASDGVATLAVWGNSVYAGGVFNSVGGGVRNNIAAIDAVSGHLTSWDPDADGPVLALAISDSVLYVGGQFENIGQEWRSYLAALDVSTGNVTGWRPGPNGFVHAIAVSGSTVYVGGEFTMFGGIIPTTRRHIAELDTAIGMATGWNPGANGTVRSLVFSGSTLYAGGNFTVIGGQPRWYVAAFDSGTESPTNWDPHPDNAVYAIAIPQPIQLASQVYIGGIFHSLGGSIRNYVAAIDRVGGAPTTWDGNSDGVIRALSSVGPTLYAGGLFTTIGGQLRSAVAALDTFFGLATAWNPSPDLYVWCITPCGPTIYLGGSFSEIGAVVQPYFAGIASNTSAVKNPEGEPKEFYLSQNFPNPFNSSTTLSFHIPLSSFVTLSLYNFLGQEIAALVHQIMPPGTHEVSIDGSRLSTGVYFCRLRAGSFNSTRKILLLR